MQKRLIMMIIFVVAMSAVAVSLISFPTTDKMTATDILSLSSVSKPQIAVIKIEGVVMSSSTTDSFIGGEQGTGSIMKQIIAAKNDANVKAVLLRINTPGGSVTAGEELATEIAKLRKTGKLVVVSMGDMATSMGYWLAVDSDLIIANPSTLTGNIGVYVPYMNMQELYKKIGIDQTKIKSGPYKDILSPDRPMTAEEQVIIQTMVDEMYNTFVEHVSVGRKMDLATVKKLADGRIYTGRQALELGLIDKLGNYYDAIEETAKLAGIEDNYSLKEAGYSDPLKKLFSYERSDMKIPNVLRDILLEQGEMNKRTLPVGG